jgi:hypothetical protein
MPSTNPNKTKVQKYKNKTKYVPNKYNPLLNSTTPTTGCCKKCFDIIEWKKQYGKYKTITKPGKCTKCLRRNVVVSYHEYCKECAVTNCAKCFVALDEENSVPVDLEEEEEEVDFTGLSERQKRSVRRKLEQGDREGVERILAQRKDTDFGLDDLELSDESDFDE